MIDDGTELFGSATPQPPAPKDELPNGFLALAVYDQPKNGGNDDGFSDAHDTIFSSLRLWKDANQNGFSEPSELKTLPELGIARIDLNYNDKSITDDHGNAFRLRARVWNLDGRHNGRWAWDVFLVVAEP